MGKRSIWSAAQHLASTASTHYFAIALDGDMALDPAWMHGMLELLASRADARTVVSLPLQNFSMQAQHGSCNQPRPSMWDTVAKANDAKVDGTIASASKRKRAVPDGIRSRRA